VLPPLLALIAVLMVSTVRYPSGKHVDLQTKMRLRLFVLIVGIVGAVLVYKEYALLLVTLGYIFYGLIRHWRRKLVQPPVANRM
jgi:CDP-diacylglycerol--serine O-phosphatidyltransferase